MVKKIISIMMVSVLLLTMFSIDTFAKKTDILVDQRIEFLKELEIITDDYSPEQIITRSEFAVLLANVLKIDIYGKSDNVYFKDTYPDNLSTYAISQLVERGLLSVGADKLFRPSDAITVNEVSKILVCALGYEPYASVKGGYPLGYNTVSLELGIISDALLKKTTLTYSDAVHIIYEALITGLYEGYHYSEIGNEYRVSDKTLLSSVYDIYFAEGMLKSADGVYIYDDEKAREGEILVGDTVIKTDKDCIPYLGRNVVAFYKKPADEEIGNCVFFAESEYKNNILTISADNFSGYNLSNNTVEYSEADGKKDKKATISTDAAFVYNKSVVKTKIPEYMASLKIGNIELVDNNDDGSYDVVFINSCRNLYVEYIDNSNKKIFGADNSKDAVSIDEDKKKIIVRTSNGKMASVADIKEGSVISAFESENVTEIYISTAYITGTIEEFIDEDIIYLTIAGKEYKVDSALSDKVRKEFSAGMNVTVYTDIYGNIAHLTSLLSADGYKYGYVIDYSDDTSSLTGKVKIKLYTVGEGVSIMTTTPKLKIDEVMAKGADEIKTSLLKGGDIKGRLLRFKTDKDGLVSQIDTTYVSPSGVEGSCNIKISNEVSDSRIRRRKFGAKVIGGANTIFLSVPDDSKLAEAEDYMFKTIANPLSDIPTDINFNGVAYKLDLESGYDDIIVIKGYHSSTTVTADLGIVDKVVAAVKDDDVREVLKCYHGGVEKKLYSADGFSISGTGVKAGDAVKLGFNENGEIASLSIVYKYSNELKLSDVSQLNPEAERFNYTDRLTAGYVYSVNDGVAKLSSSKENISEYGEVYDISESTVIIYDGDEKNDNLKFTTGTYRDIPAYDKTKEYSLVLIRQYQTMIREVILYK